MKYYSFIYNIDIGVECCWYEKRDCLSSSQLQQWLLAAAAVFLTILFLSLRLLWLTFVVLMLNGFKSFLRVTGVLWLCNLFSLNSSLFMVHSTVYI